MQNDIQLNCTNWIDKGRRTDRVFCVYFLPRLFRVTETKRTTNSPAGVATTAVLSSTIEDPVTATRLRKASKASWNREENKKLLGGNCL